MLSIKCTPAFWVQWRAKIHQSAGSNPQGATWRYNRHGQERVRPHQERGFNCTSFAWHLPTWCILASWRQLRALLPDTRARGCAVRTSKGATPSGRHPTHQHGMCVGAWCVAPAAQPTPVASVEAVCSMQLGCTGSQGAHSCELRPRQ